MYLNFDGFRLERLMDATGTVDIVPPDMRQMGLLVMLDSMIIYATVWRKKTTNLTVSAQHLRRLSQIRRCSSQLLS